ncbi:EscU/YscU/HrcU family type III secretion system export apparatus switch protein [Pannonibacter carbonis]|uniref:EscU/YscU/HrcU family type III secretion system export apparatus switch protein n=1 Tax=Pannonibacter carbonis TaxID=2067569 RepID=UPI000D10428E|nr:EscU/YscU/HrcU family type III secretion system export apparatus switch protein [Pannonibacter carbonis]
MSVKLPPASGAVPPPRLAIALKYDKQGAPTVTAKGRGAVAERIVAAAREAGVPIEADSYLAEALSGLELDEEIPAELYQAVAVLIGFILRSGRSPNPPPG